MPDYKQNDLAPVRSIYTQTSGKPVKQTEYIGSTYDTYPIRKDENNKAHVIWKSIWIGLRGGRRG
jgi:hypothetical protein